MANEAQVRISLQILKDAMDYRSQPTVFHADVSGTKGPSPGAITVNPGGTDVDLSELILPGLCRIKNLDLNHFLEYGIFDPESGVFFPLGEILPKEFYVIRLSRNLFQEFGTGTGTADIGAGTNRLRLKSSAHAIDALVEAFEA